MDQEQSKRRMRVSARENIDDVTTKTTTAILIPCYNEELTVQVVILGEAKILDLERDRLGRRVRIEVLPEVDEHVALRLVQRLQHSFQVPMNLYFGIDSGKEITKVSSLQHVTFTIAWKIAGIPVVNFMAKGASYLPMRSRPPMNGRKASGMITEPSAC